jgi:hypothetical protein
MTEHQGRDGDTRIVNDELHLFRVGQGWFALGWSAHTLGTRTWLTPAAPVEALNVPWQVGARAVANLHASGITPPAINVPGPLGAAHATLRRAQGRHTERLHRPGRWLRLHRSIQRAVVGMGHRLATDQTSRSRRAVLDQLAG